MNGEEWNIISSAYCLNLERNTQRWIDSSIQFHNVGLYDVERINCIEGENRFLSFNQSHYYTIKKGFETGKPFAVFEDDIAFDQIWKHIAEATSELPGDWDALYLGANICFADGLPTKFSRHLSRLCNVWMSHAIIYSMKGAKFVLDNMVPNRLDETQHVIDDWLRTALVPFGNTFILTPMSCYQRPVWSDMQQKEADYSSCHYDGNKILKRIHNPGIVVT